MKTVISLKKYFPEEFLYKDIGTRAMVMHILNSHLSAMTEKPDEVEVDFEEINFISHSAAHEFVKQKQQMADEGISLSFVHMNQEVSFMIDLINRKDLKKPLIHIHRAASSESLE